MLALSCAFSTILMSSAKILSPAELRGSVPKNKAFSDKREQALERFAHEMMAAK
ncbi:hypothetical protein [Desulfovibrio sp. ZJ200]|uniref:hypothetical protein n=1 Tax=Desulfovibrio sp. ZJ200 TaxID=2709792 RepID=UPI00197E6DA5|nr:hypothetical protein [Desulfovibrio sp. ZJ200]